MLKRQIEKLRVKEIMQHYNVNESSKKLNAIVVVDILYMKFHKIIFFP